MRGKKKGAEGTRLIYIKLKHAWEKKKRKLLV